MYREKQKLLFYPDYHSVGGKHAKPKEVLLDMDTSGHVAGIPDPQFSSPRQLGELLAHTPQCQECIVKQVFRYMTGRQDTRADVPVIRRAFEDFRSSGFHYRELVVSLVKQWEQQSAERSVNVAANHPAR
jgi:hypothetical protein